MASLIEFQNGSEQVQTYPLPENKAFHIGRGDGNDLSYPDGRVSRKHAQILPHHRGYLLKDQDSKNGTFVNGLPVGPQPHLLQDNDRITLGDPACATLWFRLEDETVRQAEQRLMAARNNSGMDLEVDVVRWSVNIRGQTLEERLPDREFCLLAHLWRHKPLPCPMEDLKAAGWPELSLLALSDLPNETIHTYVYRVRRYLRKNGLERCVIKNVRGIGYRLEMYIDTSVGAGS